MTPPDNDADAIVESALIRFRMDGMDVRCPIAGFRHMRVKIVPLPRGIAHGYFDLAQIAAGIDPYGCERTVRMRGAHEMGHALQILAGKPMPHCESKTDEVGRAYCMGRQEVILRLRTMDYAKVVASYADMFLEEEIKIRLWEVRRWMYKHFRTG